MAAEGHRTEDGGWRRRLLAALSAHVPVWMLLFLGAGIGFAKTGLFAATTCALTAPALLAVAAIFLARRRKAAALAALLAAFFFLGLLLALPFHDRHPPAGHIATKIAGNGRHLVSGVLSKSPSQHRQGTVFEIYATGIAPAAPGPTTTLPRLQATHGAVRLFLDGELPADATPGAHLLVSGFFRPPAAALNPGEFDFAEHLASQGILLSGSVSSPLLLTTIHSTAPLPFRVRFQIAGEKLRHRTAKAIDRLLAGASAPARGIYKALLIGDQAEVPAAVLEAFRATGCMHILSISGLHMGILTIFFYGLFRWVLGLSSRFVLTFSLRGAAAVLALLPLVVYAVLAGLNPPVIRSLLMTILVVLSLLATRPSLLVNNIAAAAFLMLVANPLLLGAASFQLSFAAVFFLALATPWFKQIIATPASEGRIFLALCRRIRGWLLASFLVSVVASLATAPLLLLHFNNVSLIAPVANLLIEPLLCFWSLLLGLVALPLATVQPAAAAFLLAAGAAGIDAAVRLATLLQKFPLASVWGASPSFMAIFLAYALTFGVFLAPTLFTTRTKIFVVLCALLLLFPCGRMAMRFFSTRTQVSFLAVGHGNSVVVEMPGNRVVLVDGGSRRNSMDVGQRIVAPFLWKKGINRLDAVLVSHDDSDHYNGLSFVLERFRPQALWVGPAPVTQASYAALLAQARALGIPIVRPRAGDGFASTRHDKTAPGEDSGKALFEVLRGNEVDTASHVTSNSQCMVFRLRHGKRSFLFPGDIEENEEREMLAAGGIARTDVLMAAHHGSRTSGSPGFLRAAAPCWLVVSADGRSPFFPAARLLDYAARGNIPLLVTGRDGAVFFSTNGFDLRMRTFLRPR